MIIHFDKITRINKLYTRVFKEISDQFNPFCCPHHLLEEYLGDDFRYLPPACFPRLELLISAPFLHLDWKQQKPRRSKLLGAFAKHLWSTYIESKIINTRKVDYHINLWNNHSELNLVIRSEDSPLEFSFIISKNPGKNFKRPNDTDSNDKK